MQTTIRFSGGKRSDFGAFDYEDVIASALKRFQHRLAHVLLHVEDVNGPRGGVDKQCRCVLHLRRMPPIVIQDRDESVGALLNRVVSRATYVLSQKLDRLSRRTKQSRRRESGVEEAPERASITEELPGAARADQQRSGS